MNFVDTIWSGRLALMLIICLAALFSLGACGKRGSPIDEMRGAQKNGKGILVVRHENGRVFALYARDLLSVEEDGRASIRAGAPVVSDEIAHDEASSLADRLVSTESQPPSVSFGSGGKTLAFAKIVAPAGYVIRVKALLLKRD